MNDRPIIKKANSGFVGHDGNGMVGGSWANTEILARKSVDVERLTEKVVSDTDKAEKCYEWLTDKIGDSFFVEAYFNVGYDHSVGLDYYCDLSEWLDPDQEVFDAIDSCPWLTPEEKVAMLGYLYDICAEEDGYELYDIDD
jgi:hypothetical protein